MIPVTLADVFLDPDRGECWLVLADPTGRRGLPIFVGSWSPTFLHGLRSRSPRPLTFEFISRILAALEAELEVVQITEVKANTYHAIARVRSGGKGHEVDARPGDAVGLAICMGRPIHVAEQLMETAGKPLDSEGRPPELPPSFKSTRWMWAEDSGPTETGHKGP